MDRFELYYPCGLQQELSDRFTLINVILVIRIQDTQEVSVRVCNFCLQSGVGAHERVRLVHLEGLHQARPGEYARERLLARARSLISFHSFADTDPVRDYNQWLRGEFNLPTADEHSGSTSYTASASASASAAKGADTQPGDGGPARVEL